MLEINIIKSLLNRENYIKYRNFVNLKDFNRDLVPYITTIDQWYKTTTNPLSLDDFYNIFFSKNLQNPELNKQIFKQLEEKQELESTKTLLESFKTKSLLEEISTVSYEITEGKKTLPELFALYDKLAQPAVQDELSYVTDDIETILDNTSRIPGLRWRLKTLNHILGSLRKGDMGFFFARPETGKTTMLASEATFMAEQLTENSEPILWFNNEEQGHKVKARIFQASLGWTFAQLLSDPKKAQEQYLANTRGKLKLIDQESLDRYTIEKYLDKTGASLIIIDQLDKIDGFKADRDDLKMGAIYQWARQLAKRYCPLIGVCQADASAEGHEYLTMAQITNAKTAKSAEADWIIGIGAKNESGFENVRYLSAIKNKLIGDSDTNPALRHGKMEVQIRPTIARYEDIY